MTSSAEALHLARQYRQAGDLRQAEQLCRQIVQRELGSAEAWQLLALVCQGQGKPTDAADCYRRVLELSPRSAAAHYGLGTALAALGRRDEAVGHYREVLRLEPGHAEAATDLGVALAEQGELEEAVAALRRATERHPGFAKAHYNLGVALAQQGRHDEAAQALRQALRAQPDYPAAHYSLGNLFREQGQREDAAASYREALRLRPDYGEAYNNLGLTLTELNRHAEAAVMLGQAVRLRPQDAGAHNNLGLALAGLGRFAEAERSYQEALRLDPRDADAHTNLGSAYKEQGRLEEALACYEVALWLKPGLPQAHWNRALAWLQQGDYGRGWPEYEWRWRRPQTPPRPLPRPRWDGSPLQGRTILLWMEQGLGDMIQFIRYAPLVQQRGGRVVVECPARMVPLFSTCRGIDRLVAEGEPLPDFDVQAPFMSLPALLATTLETVPEAVPYLSADPALVERWGRALSGIEGLRVGIAWQGNPKYHWDRYRSIPLASFAPLAAVPGVRLIRLQKGPGAEEAQAGARRFPVTELGADLDAGPGAFADTAAVMKHLELVVSADTAVAHLAGALGVPVWVAVSAVADWRWVAGRGDSPWYPTLRLFRQEKLGEWQPVFEHMARELERARSSPNA